MTLLNKASTIILCVALNSAAYAQRPAGSGSVVENAATAGPTFSQNAMVLEGADRRLQTSLDGDWHTIVDSYFTGLYTFHYEEKKDGWFRNDHWGGKGDNRLFEYDFAKSPALRVPGDWKGLRQREDGRPMTG